MLRKQNKELCLVKKKNLQLPNVMNYGVIIDTCRNV